MFMTEVELELKDLKRILSICSELFGDKKMSEEDTKLIKKLEVMHESEVEWEKEFASED